MKKIKEEMVDGDVTEKQGHKKVPSHQTSISVNTIHIT
jgi:hypothetical protein